jgi:predicted ATPase
MIQDLTIKSLGPLETIDWRGLGSINTVIGNNATGKTYLLKALYTAVKAVEETGRGHNPKKIEDILSDRLYWTFQTKTLGDLVRKGAGPAMFSMHSDSATLSFQFGASTGLKLIGVENGFPPREANSIFLPAKEVLSLFHIIKKSRDTDQVFGFDDTYLDLIHAVEIEPTKGKNYAEFSWARTTLGKMLDGKVIFENNEWIYKQGNSRYSLHATSEGIKKISILDRLLGNRYLSPESVIFIDEPEAALHPEALTLFMDILFELSKTGIQFFIATHSYFVVKKLLLIAKTNRVSLPLLSLGSGESISCFDLSKGLPENPIMAESVRLYEQEVELSFK